MIFTGLCFVGNSQTANAVASELSKLFEGSFVLAEVQHLESEVTLIYVDDGGNKLERQLWDEFGNPLCILHICNLFTPYDLHGAYQRVKVDFNNISNIEAEVTAFLTDNGLYLEESIRKL